MSVQFGRWSFDGEPVAPGYLEEVSTVLAPYGPDKRHSFSSDGVSILYYGFHSTKESRRETQPHASKSGTVITWDGRLDNRAEFIGLMRHELSTNSADVSIVAAAYERWGIDAFARLIGDWAISIWNPDERSLILAKDPIGVRHLYYSFDERQVTWSTILDPLILFAAKTFALDEEYIAGWLSLFPAAHLTPYAGIHSVPPSSFVCLKKNRTLVNKYWDFNPAKRIRYRTDAEYEEHFRTVFASSVRRRLRSDSPVLAELSGGMDSSSIVCMADTVLTQEAVEMPRLDTLSYYDDSEPNWNERPYFTNIEQKRGRTGCHINVGSQERFTFEFETEHFASSPGSSNRSAETTKQYAAYMISQGHRVVLSGIGGDEVTGGVPTPTPELADLLARCRIEELAHQLKVWALHKRKPWLHLLFEAARGFLPPALIGVSKQMRPAPWLHSKFVKLHQAAFIGYETKLRLFGALPSFQQNLITLSGLRRQLGCDALPSDPTYEKRYPYLDRDLLEFLFAIPRDQLVRPGQRRSLMRRALVGLVPNEILNRRRKAFVARAPMAAISTELAGLTEMSQRMQSSSLGIVDAHAFREALNLAAQGKEILIVPLLRIVMLESWLRNLSRAALQIVPPVGSSQSRAANSIHVYPQRWTRTNEIQSKRIECS
jgi:asparagine synthase (glutamine-hydrolysing)